MTTTTIALQDCLHKLGIDLEKEFLKRASDHESDADGVRSAVPNRRNQT